MDNSKFDLDALRDKRTLLTDALTSALKISASNKNGPAVRAHISSLERDLSKLTHLIEKLKMEIGVGMITPKKPELGRRKSTNPGKLPEKKVSA